MENKKTVPLIILVLVLFFGAWLVKVNYIDKPTLITVTGEGRLKTVPTQAQMTLNITNYGATATQALVDNQKLTKNIILTAESIGSAKEDIDASYTKVIPINLEKGQFSYQANNSLNITLKGLSNFDSKISKLYGAGANSITDIIFTTGDSNDLEKQAVAKAVDDAKIRIGEIAKGLGKRVGRTVSLRTSEVGQAGAMSGQFEQNAVQNSSPSQIEIVRQAVMVFELK